MADQQSRDRS